MFTVDREFADRIKRLNVREVANLAERAAQVYPETLAETIAFGDGIAIFGGDEIPLNEVVGLALDGVPESAEIDALAEFYDEHRVASTVLVSSLADPGQMSAFAAHGWQPTGFEDVFVLPMEDRAVESCVESAWAGMDIRVVRRDQREEWARCVVEGFATGTPSEHEYRFGRIIAARPDATFVWAWADGKPVATGELTVSGGMAWLSADSTAPEYRGRGIQQALQRFRIALAREQGCEIACIEANPGGSSHRNIQRVGFRLAFTHLLMTRGPQGG